jgi:hypothetical protein
VPRCDSLGCCFLPTLRRLSKVMSNPLRAAWHRVGSPLAVLGRSIEAHRQVEAFEGGTWPPSGRAADMP